jgi:hypothetical protein
MLQVPPAARRNGMLEDHETRNEMMCRTVERARPALRDLGGVEAR